MAVLPKLIYRFKIIPVNTPACFYRSWLILEFILKCKEPRIHKTILKKNKRVTKSNFNTYSNTIVSRQFNISKKRYIRQWIRIRRVQKQTHTYVCSIHFCQKCCNSWIGKGMSFQQLHIQMETNEHSPLRHTRHQKLTLTNEVTDLSVQPIKLLEENKEENLCI